MSTNSVRVEPYRNETEKEPCWFHLRGSQFFVVGHDHLGPLKERKLTLKARCAQIEIWRDRRHPKWWNLKYEIKHFSGYTKGFISGMTAHDLIKAFGLSDECDDDELCQKIIANYGGDVARQGMYIRCGKYLCIPGPGTGGDGEPIVSVYVDEDVQHAMAELLSLS
jgi:hypothetical protein